jgi:hypothetical protein
MTTGTDEVLPIAPFERDLAKAKRLPWVDFNTGKPLCMDWNGQHLEGTVPVTRLSEYVDNYQCHPEAKAADKDGSPAGPDTIGLLGRLKVRSGKPARIGKEIDRLKEDEAASLEPDQPIEYRRDELAADIDYLAYFPQEAIAAELGLTVRGWRNLVKGASAPRRGTVKRIREIATKYALRDL